METEEEEMKTLTKELDSTIFTTGTGQPDQDSWFEDWQESEDGSNRMQKAWIKLGGNNAFSMYCEEYIDLNGLQIEDESIFFDGITATSPYPPIIAGKTSGTPNPPAGASLLIADIITSVPLVLDDYNQWAMDWFAGIGYKDSQYDFEHVIYYRSQTWSTDVDYQGFICNLTNQSQSGSGMPTASDRLYCYRFVIWTTQVQNARVSIPPLRFVLAVTPKKESELEYIYRLKRSYELQQSFDRD